MKTKRRSGVWYISSVNTVRKIAVAEASWLMLSSTLMFAELPDLRRSVCGIHTPESNSWSPNYRVRTPVRTPSPRQPSGKDHWNQWSPYNLTLLQLEQTTGSSGRRGTAPPTEPGFSQGFFSVLSPMEFGFLAAVASGLLSWGHFISSNIIDLIAQILFKLNWDGRWHHWIQ